MIALAHVEAPRVADIARVGEVDILLGAHGAPAVARLLQGNAVLVALGDVKKGARIRPDEPFVGRKHQKVRIEFLHVEIEHAGAMGGVHQQRGAAGAQRRSHAAKVDHAAVGPVHR